MFLFFIPSHLTPRSRISATDDEDCSNSYPIGLKYQDIFDDIVAKWRVTPLPGFDASGKFIKVSDLENSLRGSLVLVYFELKHYAIKDKKTNGVAGNTFSAIATQVKILERGPDRRPSPYKSLLLKGPKSLPQSPSKRKEQINAVNAFHPGNIILAPCFFCLIHALPASTLSSLDNPLPSVSSLKKDGKKRAVEDEGDTATNDEGASSNKTAKRKKPLPK